MKETFSSVQAQLNCMSDLLITSQTWNYVIKLTSSTFPVTSQTQLMMHLRRLNSYNFVPASRVTLATNQRTGLAGVANDAMLEDLMHRHTLEARDGTLKFR